MTFSINITRNAVLLFPLKGTKTNRLIIVFIFIQRYAKKYEIRIAELCKEGLFSCFIEVEIPHILEYIDMNEEYPFFLPISTLACKIKVRYEVAKQ